MLITDSHQKLGKELFLVSIVRSNIISDRCPNNILDFYEAIKYIIGHAGQLGVDSSRVCIAGESGGGYICSGAMVHLARKGEGHLVKLAIPVIPMLTDYSFTDKTAMTNAEAENAEGQKKVWRLIAGPKVRDTLINIYSKHIIMKIEKLLYF